MGKWVTRLELFTCSALVQMEKKNQRAGGKGVGAQGGMPEVRDGRRAWRVLCEWAAVWQWRKRRLEVRSSGN